MRRGRIALLAALPAASLALAPAGASSPTLAPTLRIVDLSPAMARGAHFAPGTKVHVTLVAGQTKVSRAAWASNGGWFVVGFGALPREDRCSGKVMLFAIGASGQRAHYRLPIMNCITNRLDKAAVASIEKASVGTVDKASVAGVEKASVTTVDKAGSSSTSSAAGVSR